MSESAVGFSLSENLLRVAQVVRRDGSIRIEKLNQKRCPHPFRLLTLDNQERFQTLLSTLEDVFEQDNWPATMGVSIPNELVLIKEFPVDDDLSQNELENQVHWEASQFLPDELSAEYVLSYQRLNFEQVSVLLVAFRELVLHRVRQAFDTIGSKPRFLGVDVFAALSAVNALYELNEGLSALLEVGENRAHLMLLKGGDYLVSKKLPYALAEEKETALFDNPEALAGFLKKESRKLLLDRKIDEGEMPFSQLFVYGEKASAELITALEDGPAVEVLLVDPFQPGGADEEVVEEEWRQNPSVWAPAVGVALQALESD